MDRAVKPYSALSVGILVNITFQSIVSMLSPATTESSITTTITMPMTTTSKKTSFQCFDCSGTNCGNQDSTVSMNCPSCMIYRSPDDSSTNLFSIHVVVASVRMISIRSISAKIERRCCWWACGASNSVSIYNGRETYFCTDDKCNGHGAESMLSNIGK
jgi:hypothetical protein